MTRVKWEVRWVGGLDHRKWMIRYRSSSPNISWIVLWDDLNKKDAIRLAMDTIESLDKNSDGGYRAELYIYNKLGQVSDRRTYPRASDPKRRKG